MTEKQRDTFNNMLRVLLVISKGYQSTRQLRKDSEKDYGLDYTEALEMAYENIQDEAARAVKGVKTIHLASQPISQVKGE